MRRRGTSREKAKQWGKRVRGTLTLGWYCCAQKQTQPCEKGDWREITGRRTSTRIELSIHLSFQFPSTPWSSDRPGLLFVPKYYLDIWYEVGEVLRLRTLINALRYVCAWLSRMSVCVCICLRMHMPAYAYACVLMPAYECMRINACVWVYAYAYACVCMYAYVCLRMNALQLTIIQSESIFFFFLIS
jgi:hypothetical protein